MKELDIQIDKTFSTTTGTIEENDNEFGALRAAFDTAFDNAFDEELSKDFEKLRNNGGKILFATTSIEKKMECLLLRVFMGPMGPFQGSGQRRTLFKNEILQSTALSYSAKKELVFKAINILKILTGSDKSKLQTHLKSIMEWRNAFAHGSISHVHERGYSISYYSGGNKSLELTNIYWEEVENTFQECNELLLKALENLEKKDA